MLLRTPLAAVAACSLLISLAGTAAASQDTAGSAQGDASLRQLPPRIERPWVTAGVSTMTSVGIVGVTAAFTRPGEPLWATSAGATARAQDGGTPLTTEHRMRIGSITKPIVATAVMRLVERGVWKLSDTANSIKPGVLAGHDDVTVQQLLSHTSGLVDGVNVLAVQAGIPDDAPISAVQSFFEQPRTVDDAIRATLSVPNKPAGSVGRYSNTNYFVLGRLLEHTHKATLRDVLLQEVFGPAGMRTAELVDAEHFAHDTRQYAIDFLHNQQWVDLSGQHPGILAAAGAVDATPGDVVRFWQALAQGVLVKPATWDLMRTPTPQSLAPMPTDPADYGVGERPLSAPYGLGVATFRFPPIVRCERADGSQITEVYGHDGSTLGTASVSLVSADGTSANASSYNSVPVDNQQAPSEASVPWYQKLAALQFFSQHGWFCDKFSLTSGSTRTLPTLPRVDAFPLLRR